MQKLPHDKRHIHKLHDPDLRSQLINEANFTSKAIRNLTNLSGATFIICLTGATLNEPQLLNNFCQDVVALKQAFVNIIIVHEGGVFLEQSLEKLGIKSDLINHLYIASKQHIEIFEMVLSGYVNKKIVSAINKIGGMAIGLSGKDANLLEARKIKKMRTAPDSNVDQMLNLASIGEATVISPDILIMLENTDIIPVISPVALSKEGDTLYLDAINVGSIIASSLIASKYIILSDEILKIDDKIVASLDYQQAKKLSVAADTSPIMRDMLSHSIVTLENHTDMVHLIDSNVDHALLLELLSDEGIGTKIDANVML